MYTARIIVLIIALGAGGIAAYLASGNAPDNKPQLAEPAAQLQTVDVLVAKSDIGLGQSVKPEDVQWQAWPWVAVIWSGFWNFLGVLLGGISVAVGIINLLPVETLVDQNIAHSLSMVVALLLTAIFWNLGTWYLGIPCSSSHTLIGSILGVGLAYSLLPEAAGEAVNWGEAAKIGSSLLISPLFGFSVTIILMYLIRNLTKQTSYGDSLFKEPKKDKPPPTWIRYTYRYLYDGEFLPWIE